MARCSPLVSSLVIGLDRRASRGEMPKRAELGRGTLGVPNPPRGEDRVPGASALRGGVFGASAASEESNETEGDGGDGARAVVDPCSTSFAVSAPRAVVVPPSTEPSGSDLSTAGVNSSRFLSCVPRICSAFRWDGPGLRGGARRDDW